MTEARTYTSPTWNERSTLTAMVGYVRATAAFKCEDLADDLAHAAPLPTSPLSSIGGFVNPPAVSGARAVRTYFPKLPLLSPSTRDEPDRETSQIRGRPSVGSHPWRTVSPPQRIPTHWLGWRAAALPHHHQDRRGGGKGPDGSGVRRVCQPRTSRSQPQLTSTAQVNGGQAFEAEGRGSAPQ